MTLTNNHDDSLVKKHLITIQTRLSDRTAQQFLALAQTGLKRRIYCQCKVENNGVPLDVFRRGQAKEDVRYFLRVAKNTAQDHDTKCPFYKDATVDGADVYTDDVITTTDRKDSNSLIGKEQITRINRLGFTLSTAIQTTSSDKRVFSSHQPHSTPARSVSLAGLLHLIIATVGYNRWFYPEEQKATKNRPRSFAYRAIKSLAERKVFLGRKQLNDALFIAYPDPYRGKETYDQYINTYKAKKQNHHLVLFQLQRPKKEEPLSDSSKYVNVCAAFGYTGCYNNLYGQYSPNYFLAGLKSEQNIFTKYAVQTREKIYSIVNDNEDPIRSKNKVIVLALARSQGNVKKHINQILDLAFVITNEYYVPIDSNFENQYAGMLIQKNIKFVKPVPLEETTLEMENTLPYRPDFIIPSALNEGVVMDVFVEVFGMSTPEYREQQAKKERHYRCLKNINFIPWRANDGEPMPVL